MIDTIRIRVVANNEDTASRKKRLIRLPDWYVMGQTTDKNCSEQCEYGIAFDIGTTTVVGMLWNLQEEKLVDAYGMTTPQRYVGADVISRIQYCNESKVNQEHLHTLICECMNQILNDCIKVIGDKNRISHVSIVGNTVMSCIIQNRSVKDLIRPPFPIDVHVANEYHGSENVIGLCVGDETQVYCLPGIGGHIGSDITAMILATNMVHEEGNSLAIDIGTNGEIVLAKNGSLLACSTAAGPAFEGASIQFGMRATKGAIEGVMISEKGVQLQIIESLEAEGICGSGLIEVVAAMLDIGLIDNTGRIRDMKEAIESGVPKIIATRLQSSNNGIQFVLQYRYAKEPIVITQNDIREVQLAKSAIYSGMRTLMNTMDMNEEDLDCVYQIGRAHV